MNARRFGGAGIRRGVRAPGSTLGFPDVASALVRFNGSSRSVTMGTGPDVASVSNLIAGGPAIAPAQATAASRPHLVTDKGVTVIEFDGTDDYLDATLGAGTLWSSGAYVARVSIQRIRTTGVNQFTDGVYVAAGNIWGCTSRIQSGAHDSSIQTGAGLPTGTSYGPPADEYYVYRSMLTPTGIIEAVDGYEYSAALVNTGSNQAPDSITLGARPVTFASPCQLSLYEWALLVNTDPDQLAADAAAVEAYYLSIKPETDALTYTTGLVMRNQADQRDLTVVSGDVSGWSGQVNGHALAQASAGSRPAWNTEQLVGYPTIAFAADEYMTGSASTDFAFGTGSWMYVAIIKRPAGAGVFTLRAFSDATTADGARIRIQANDYPYIFWGDDTESYPVGFVALPNNTWTALFIGVDAVSGESFIKVGAGSVVRSSITVQSLDSTVPQRLHGDSTNATQDDDSFVLREELVYSLGSTELTDTIIGNVASYVTSKYGIAT